MKLKFLAASAVSALALGAAGSASADIVFCNGGGCAEQGETVHLGADNGTAGSPGGAKLVIGDLQSGLVDVLIRSNEAIHTTSDGNGQAWIVANDYVQGSGNDVDVGGLKTLTFALETGWWFTGLEFRLTPADTASQGPTPPWSITLKGFDENGDEFTSNFSGMGANEFFNADAINGQHILSVTFTTNNEMAKAAQIRIDGASLIPTTVVPEPATWGLMIMGFGGMGAVMRRRRARYA